MAFPGSPSSEIGPTGLCTDKRSEEQCSLQELLFGQCSNEKEERDLSFDSSFVYRKTSTLMLPDIQQLAKCIGSCWEPVWGGQIQDLRPWLCLVPMAQVPTV